MINDPHDRRPFRKWITFHDDGTVAAEHEFVASAEQPLPVAVEVTHLVPMDLSAIAVDPALVQGLKASVDDVQVSLIDAVNASAKQDQTMK